ncbi:protealysin inhibitor emfourin [Nonomuraea sp. B12E4]|uniref:protealysin inhibitor emfourin n=1 Tax=Nonomuraea sp. B12E4 TaxID=3153564 RepID=UPI00325CBF30
MRVRIEKAGGLAGLQETVAGYDTDELTPREAARVYGALAAIEAATVRGEAGEVGADLITYRITVGDGDGRVFTVSDEPPRGLANPLAVLLRPAG